MVFVTSDLHGCPLEEFQQLLDRAGFTEDDFLFVLGDVIDRGKYGAELLLWLTEQPNMQLLLGNHEALLLACDFLFEEVTEESLSRLSKEQCHLLEAWIRNGGAPTMAGLRKLLRRDAELVYGILDYLRDAPLYECIAVNGRDFILVHAGLENFSPHRPLPDYEPDELFCARPALDTEYFDDATVIFGHTPTGCFGEQYRGSALKTPSWICIDTGAASGNLPMLLRLDDLREFY